MFKTVIAFICASTISVSDCNDETARVVIYVPEDSGCFDAQAYISRLAIEFDRKTEYIKVTCR